MKVFKTLAATLVIGSVSFGVMAAKEVTKEEVKSMNLQKIGTVTTTAETSAPMDAKKELSKKADDLGGQYFLVIAGTKHEKISATADVYK